MSKGDFRHTSPEINILTIFDSSSSRNSFMKHFICAFSLSIIGQILFAQSAQKNIYFSVDSFRLSVENVDLIQKSFDAMGPGDKSTFRVLIHDDTKNKGLINELDRKRSAELYDFFALEGVPAANLKVIKTPGREAKGFISDDMKNLMIYDVEVYKALPSETFTTVSGVDLVTQAPQVFGIGSDAEQKIQGREGTELIFPAGVFEFKTGISVTGQIKIELNEFMTPQSVASAGLMTMSGSKSLAMAGIIRVKASSNGKEVRIKKGRTVQVTFPSRVSLPDSKLYSGSLAEGILDLHPVLPPVNAVATDLRYTVSTPSLHWLACAAEEKATAKGNLVLKVSVNYPVTARVVIAEEYKVYASSLASDSKDLVFKELPLGKKGYLVAYGEKDGKVYAFSKELTTSAEGKEKVSLREVTPDILQAMLKGEGK
jgi:hypothetical protein